MPPGSQLLQQEPTAPSGLASHCKSSPVSVAELGLEPRIQNHVFLGGLEVLTSGPRTREDSQESQRPLEMVKWRFVVLQVAASAARGSNERRSLCLRLTCGLPSSAPQIQTAFPSLLRVALLFILFCTQRTPFSSYNSDAPLITVPPFCFGFANWK